MNELVVVGYGTQRRGDVTGAIASVNTKTLEGTPIRSVDQALQGRVAGVTFVQNSGMPGAGSSIRVRGGNSINGSNEPLYVIDGVPVFADQGSDGTSLNPLNSISPTDIASIEILKDASATAIYGSRGGNGVVLITTKRGSFDQKTNYDFNATRGIRKITNSYRMLETPDYIRARRGMKQDYALWNNPDLPNTDWFDALYEDGLEQNYQLSISGGTTKTRYYISGSYEREDGIQKSNYWERFALRVNGDYKLGKRLLSGISSTWQRSPRTLPRVIFPGAHCLTWPCTIQMAATPVCLQKWSSPAAMMWPRSRSAIARKGSCCWTACCTWNGTSSMA